MSLKEAVCFIIFAVLMATILSLSAFNSIPNKVTLPPPAIKFSSIVRITQNGDTFCTGVVVSKHFVLTAMHCTPTITKLKTEIDVRPSGEENLGIFATVEFLRFAEDQAILKGDFSQFDIAILAKEDVKIAKGMSERLVACGYADGARLVCNRLSFSRNLSTKTGYKQLKGKNVDYVTINWDMNGELAPGMSGGPVMTSDGIVVATNEAVMNDPELTSPESIVSPVYGISVLLQELER